MDLPCRAWARSMRLFRLRRRGFERDGDRPGDGSQIALNAERTAPHDDQSLAGTYTVLLPAVPGTPSPPGGNGFGTLTVSDTGTVKFSGKLGDGVPATISGALDSNGVWPFLFARAAANPRGRNCCSAMWPSSAVGAQRHPQLVSDGRLCSSRRVLHPDPFRDGALQPAGGELSRGRSDISPASILPVR